MSLLWPNQQQLLIALGAEKLSLILRKGFAKKIVAKHHESYVKLASESAWRAALLRLDIQLAALSLPSNTTMHITLASDLVRYIVLPGHDIAMSSKEKLGYAQAAFLEIYGAVADNWKICIDDTAPQQPALVAAIDMSMYEAIADLAAKYNLKLTSVEPYLMTAYNKLFSSIKNANATLVVVEQTRVATLCLQNGVCHQTYIEKYASDWQMSLEQTLTRNQLFTNQISKELMIYAPTLTSIKHELSKKFSCKRLNVRTQYDALPADFAMLEALA